MKPSLTLLGLLACSAVGCMSASGSTDSLAQADTSADLGSHVNLTGRITVNGQPIADSPLKRSGIFITLSSPATDEMVRGLWVNPDSTYSVRLPKGPYRVALKMTMAGCDGDSVPSGPMFSCHNRVVAERFLEQDTALDISVPVAKLMSQISVGDQPLSQAKKLAFRETTTGEVFSFFDLTRLQPFEAYLFSGTYEVKVEPSFGGEYLLASALHIE